ncbi:MAG: response regulator [Proteobacteria bacterium]|nr:response regulator [Pseudomonadota bacterium]
MPEDKRKLSILLAEDSEDIQLLVRTFLKETSYHLDVAHNDEIAFKKFIPSHYDLVLMDLQMPIMDGYRAVKKMRECEKGNGEDARPIIAMTAHAFKGEREKCLKALARTRFYLFQYLALAGEL